MQCRGRPSLDATNVRHLARARAPSQGKGRLPFRLLFSRATKSQSATGKSSTQQV